MKVLSHLAKESLIWSSIKPRKNSLRELTPVCFLLEITHKLLWRYTGHMEQDDFEQRIREESIKSLKDYKDICVFPRECRYFFYYCSEEPLRQRSKQFFNSREYSRLTPRKLYITKGCILRVSGFRLVRASCPHKSERELTSFGSQKKKEIHSTIPKS